MNNNLNNNEKLGAEQREVAEFTVPNPVVTPPKKKRNIATIIFSIILILLVAGFWGFWYLKGDTIVFKQNMNSLFARAIFEEKSVSTKGGLKALINLKQDSEEVNETMELNLDLDITFDLVKKLANANAKLLIGDGEIKALAYVNGENTYVSFNEEAARYYELDNEIQLFDFTEEDKLSNNDYNKIVRHLNISVNNNITDLVSSKKKIKLGTKEYNAKKIELEIDNELFQKIASDFFKRLRDDETLKLGESIQEKINEIEESVKEADEKLLINYSIYMDKLTVLKHEIKLFNSEKLLNTLTYEVYYNEAANKVEAISLSSDEDTLTFTVVHDNDKHNFTIVTSNDDQIEGTYVKEDDKHSLDIKIFTNDEEYSLKMDYFKENKKVDILLSIPESKTSLTAEVTYDENAVPEEKQISEALSFSDLDEEDLGLIIGLMIISGQIMS